MSRSEGWNESADEHDAGLMKEVNGELIFSFISAKSDSGEDAETMPGRFDDDDDVDRVLLCIRLLWLLLLRLS